MWGITGQGSGRGYELRPATPTGPLGNRSWGRGGFVDLSLIICTRNRSRGLSQCLAAVKTLAFPGNWELVVVDNGSTDSTPSVLRDFAQSAPFPVIRCLEHRRGLSRARNAGIRVSSGKILAFTDDDCYPNPDYLVEIARSFAGNKVAFIGGRVLLHDPSDYPVTVKNNPRSMTFDPFSFLPAGAIHGANMAVMREVFTKVGGFDVSLGAGTQLSCGEDTEFLARTLAAGFRGAYLPGPTVRHHHGRKATEAMQLKRRYDFGRGAYYAAMVLRQKNRITYLKNWWWATTWKRRREASTEVAGALLYVAQALVTLLAGRHTIPGITEPPAV
jgi:glycosyltransferase involved in cell wall biosynthesis